MRSACFGGGNLRAAISRIKEAEPVAGRSVCFGGGNLRAAIFPNKKIFFNKAARPRRF